MRRTVLGIRTTAVALLALAGIWRCAAAADVGAKTFRAGASTIDVSPTVFPVVVNGGFIEARADKVRDKLHARCLVLDDGSTRLALVVVDSCMMPRDLIDRAKELAREKTGIPVNRMLVSATHTHSAPSAMGALGSSADENYVRSLPARIAEGIERAAGRLEPARIGWAAVDDFEHTHCRRWIRRPDRRLADPFGGLTVRANMHPGHLSPDVVGPAGPVDPGLSVVAVQARDGRPIAVLANYSMHYFGASPVSADYYGAFAVKVASLLGAGGDDSRFVGIMSQGTSGDQQWMDYGRPRPDIDIDTYASQVARRAFEATGPVAYRDWVPLAMAETTLTLARRVPDEKRLAWARGVVAGMAGRTPRDQAEVYAREAIALHDDPVRSLKLQAVRIGDLGIAAIPDEVYAITGLKIKALSPTASTFTVELANGSEGYIPPPEQHLLGGYTTWPARTAALETEAEPKIVDAVLGLLEEVSGKRRRVLDEAHGPYARAVLESRPLAYWRLGEIAGPRARDASGHENHGAFEGGVALFLEGPPSPRFSGEGVINRAPHFAGGRVRADLKGVGAACSVSLWFWNGLPDDARAVTGVLVARGPAGSAGDRLALGGTGQARGRLVFSKDGFSSPGLAGKSRIALRTWHHVVLVRDGTKVAVYLDGRTDPEIDAEVGPAAAGGDSSWSLGGGNGGAPGFEGKIDEVAVYDRALSPGEVAAQFRAASGPGS